MRLVVFLVLQFASLVFAEDTANCAPGWTWASNSRGQNPCVISGALDASCRSLASWNFSALPETYVYFSPSQDDPGSLDCECNTVLYSLIMACTACQNTNSTITTWSRWIANCPLVYVTQYPHSIPSDTSVPHWAYLNVTASNTWSAVDSQVALDSPESTGTPAPTANTGTSSTFQLPTGTSASGTSASSSHSNAGAIAGGVVGGLAGLGILAGLITWFVMRKRRAVAAGQAVSSDYGHTQPALYPPTSPVEPPMKLYNPNDPSSFPTGGYPTPSNNSGTTYPATLYDQRGRYSGVPEI